MTCGEKIIELRKRSNMTQQQLGDVLNVSAQAVSKWEHDMAEPDLSTIKNICVYFKISTDEFFGLEKCDLNSNIESTNVEAESNIENAVVATQVAEQEFLGVCTNCGIAVNNNNIGIKTPKLYCKNCYTDMLAQKELDRKNKIAHERFIRREAHDRDVHLRNKSIRWGLLFTIPIFVANILIMVFGGFEITPLIVYAALTVFGGYAIYALVADYIIDDGIVGDILEFFICAPIRFPGVIFSFDLGGFIFLIAIKVLFAILGFVIGVILFFVGVAIGSVVAAFVFPFHMARLNYQIKENIQ